MTTQIEVTELRLENYAANNHKFYRTYTWGNWGLTQWGRIGSKGQFKKVSAVECQRKVNEKRGEGYEISTPPMTFSVSDTTASSLAAGNMSYTSDLAAAANMAIADRVSTRPAMAPAKTEAEVEEDFAKQLLDLKGKYGKTDEAAPAAPAEPETPQVDPNSIEGRLGAALSAARSGT
jgi:predicted DNA-binding WGR domain protein